MMPADNPNSIDALFIFPPLYAEHYVGLIDEDLICDAGHPFEYPQGLLSIASYLSSDIGGKRQFRSRVLHLDAHLYNLLKSDRTTNQDTIDLEFEACKLAEEYVRTLNPRVVGISVLYYMLEPIAQRIAQHIKLVFGDQVLVGFGGQEVSFYNSEDLQTKMEHVDFIARRHGEYTMQSILECLEHEDSLSSVLGISYRDASDIHINNNRGSDFLLNLPGINNRLLLLPADMSFTEFISLTNVSLVFMRGCAFGKCAFCTSREWFGPFDRFDDLSSSELNGFLNKCEALLKELLESGLKELQLLDEAINSSPRYFMEMCALLRKLNATHEFKVIVETRVDLVTASDLLMLKRAGVVRLYLGIESGSKRVLEVMGKNIGLTLLTDTVLMNEVSGICREFHSLEPEFKQVVAACYLTKSHGLSLGLFFMVGHPGSTRAEELSTKELIRILFESGILDDNDIIELGIFMPLNGTASRSLPQVKLIEDDKRRWGRMSGHAVCELIDPNSGRTTFSKEDIETTFKELTDFVLSCQTPEERTSSRWRSTKI